MKHATGRWVSGPDFFNRSKELTLLRSRVEEGNHVLLTGQRRMGKTSIAQELGRRLETDGWAFLFTDVEDAKTPEDFIAEIAEASHSVKGLLTRFLDSVKNHITDAVEEVSAYDFKLKIRAGLNAGTWKSRGESLFASCANHDQPVLLVIDELPIFLTRLLNQSEDGPSEVENFLSWFRRQLQTHSDGRLVILVSGSIGLEPLVRRLGLTDRINHLDPPFRVRPWDRATSFECLTALATNYGISYEDGVLERVYELLGIGIPHHVQSFFVRLREDAVMQDRNTISLGDVERLYNNGMLGPSGQNDLAHYEKRLRVALDEQSLEIAMEITTEAAIEGAFGPQAKQCLINLYRPLIPDVMERLMEVLEVLVHDGYLKHQDVEYRFESNLLRDWWRARYEGHYDPLCGRLPNLDGEESQQHP